MQTHQPGSYPPQSASVYQQPQTPGPGRPGYHQPNQQGGDQQPSGPGGAGKKPVNKAAVIAAGVAVAAVVALARGRAMAKKKDDGNKTAQPVATATATATATASASPAASAEPTAGASPAATTAPASEEVETTESNSDSVVLEDVYVDTTGTVTVTGNTVSASVGDIAVNYVTNSGNIVAVPVKVTGNGNKFNFQWKPSEMNVRVRDLIGGQLEIGPRGGQPAKVDFKARSGGAGGGIGDNAPDVGGNGGAGGGDVGGRRP